MKNKAIWVSFIALLAMALALNTVIAETNTTSNVTDFVSIDRVEVNGVVLDTATTFVGKVSDTVPVEVQLSALKDVNERVKVKVLIDGFKEDVEETAILSTPLRDGVHGYVARFTLTLPSARDLNDLSQDISLDVRVSASGEDSVENSYKIKMERELYSLNTLSVYSPDKATPGTNVPIDVVVENNGNERLDNVYVRASIPELGVERILYFGDLGPRPENDEEYYENIKDSVNKVLYLSIPKSANAGTYNLEVEAYNYDTSTTVKKKIVVESVQSGVVPSVTSRSVNIGEETTFDVVLVNPNDRMVVYSLIPDQTKGLTVEISEPVVAVGADSSKTVVVKVKALDSAEEGTHLVTVNVNSEAGLERKVNLTLNVAKKSTTNTGTVNGITGENNTVLVLTVILVIIFIVLLIVLIVLLTRKPAETEEFGETSYY